MKKKMLLIALLISIFTLNVIAENKNNTLTNARLYEKSIEARLDGTFEWYPFADGEYDAEYGVDFQLGESDNPENFTYFYDSKNDYLVQYFDLETDGIIIWRGDVPLDYEEFN